MTVPNTSPVRASRMNSRLNLIVAGPGIKTGGVIQQMNLRDIAPFIAKVLELDLPTAEGKIPAILTGK